MAAGTPTITFDRSRANRLSPNAKMITGTITFSANSTFEVSTIAKKFRQLRTLDVTGLKVGVNYAGTMFQKSTTNHIAGLIALYATSGKSGVQCAFHQFKLINLKGQFVAFGA